MSEVSSQSPIPASAQVADQDPVMVSVDTSQPPRGEHEDAILTTEDVPGDETPHEPASRPIVDTELDESLVVHNAADLTPDAPEVKAPSAIAKPKPSVKPPLGKSTGGPATPTVKKARVQRVDVTGVC